MRTGMCESAVVNLARFKGRVFFSHGETNSCGVLTAYFGKETFTFKKQETDKEGRILIPHASINDSEQFLINLYNSTTETRANRCISNMFVLLKESDTNPKNS